MRIKNSFIFVFALVLILVPSTIFGESNFQDITTVQLDMLKVDLPYSEDEIDILRTETFKSVNVKVYDKSNGDLLEQHTEVFDPIMEKEQISPRSNDVSYVRRTLMSSFNEGPATIDVGARVTVAVWGTSMRQIDSVEDMFQFPGTGSYTLLNERTYLNTTKLPATGISLNAIGSIQISKSNAISAGLDFEFFESIKWNISGSVTSEWYARKTYNRNVSLRV